MLRGYAWNSNESPDDIESHCHSLGGISVCFLLVGIDNALQVINQDGVHGIFRQGFGHLVSKDEATASIEEVEKYLSCLLSTDDVEEHFDKLQYPSL